MSHSSRVDHLKANTEYSSYSVASPVIQWFWEIVQGFSKEHKARFLQFVTGTSKVPLENICATKVPDTQGERQHQPYALGSYLCSFNQLDLPEYTYKDQLQERLLVAIHDANGRLGLCICTDCSGVAIGKWECVYLFHSLLDPTSWQHEASALVTARRFSTSAGKWPRCTRMVANRLLQIMCKGGVGV